MKVIFFDTETTGLDFKESRIIELAMLIVEDGKIEEYDEFINVGFDLPSKITEITGITDEMLITEGISEAIVAEDLKSHLTPGTLMIAHNCQFDLTFVYGLLKRHYPDEAEDIVSNLNWIDTVTVLKDRKEFPHKLIDAVKYYGIEEVNFHRAIDDTKALYDVTVALKNERDDLVEYINVFGYNPKWGVSGPKFPFIEYKRQYFNKRIVEPDDILPKK
ncbi:MAG: 3'-5' exonuclease [Methanobrevibacter thaueri]|uniref:3'-5' exonuclease n=1 Tax=Methanobrevibacter thaueri TaxID=190975 RepID=A0A8T3VC95_9EURY|nr:3'-5' exonuclease [Methanobrevibacter thaueri]MBE6502480.1 3'-5' exonuclease [Methanobrevibacter thaueri]